MSWVHMYGIVIFRATREIGLTVVVVLSLFPCAYFPEGPMVTGAQHYCLQQRQRAPNEAPSSMQAIFMNGI